MKQMPADFYQCESLFKIMKGEEKRGNLREEYYSQEVVDLSRSLRDRRAELRKSSKDKRMDLLDEIHRLKEKLDEKKEEAIKQKAPVVSSGKISIDIKEVKIKGHQAYVAENMETMLVCQIIKLELRRSYKLYPANMNMIVEQMKALLDNPMPKVIIRTDIQSFFESIPQQGFVRKLLNDGFISRRSVKYLKGILYRYNELTGNVEGKGLPRGLAFSSHLSELYMRAIDAEIKRLDGVYFYKRYVDDIIIIADPSKCSEEEYWEKLNSIIESRSLRLHQGSEKQYITTVDENTKGVSFDYLGYKFSYTKGEIIISLSSKRFMRYKILLDAIFEIYAKCSHYRKAKICHVAKGESKYYKRDALKQLFDRLEVLTSNGFLSGRKNFVATGIYYSNRYLTDLSKLKQLDEYLSDKIDNKESFCPPACLFNYGEGNGYDKNVVLIKRKLHDYSFVRGFESRKLFRKDRFSKVMQELKYIYYSKGQTT